MDEVWKAIKGYEGLYEVSDWGRVRSLGMWANGKNGSKCWRKGRILKLSKNKLGYCRVALCKDDVVKHWSVHRLVAEAFLPNPDNLPCVNHKDENPTNNHINNLEWCTYKYNTNYGTCKSKISKHLTNHPNKIKTVYMYALDSGLCGLWSSTAECGRNGFDQASVADCCRGERKTHKGFKWSYEPPKPPKALPYYVT